MLDRPAIACITCKWERPGRDDEGLTLATAPWTRALWAEVERLRAEAAHRDTWAGLMEQLDRHYPADLTQEGAVLDGPGGAVVRMAREVERLHLELAESRLVLAAEQGRQEGAPSAGWEYREGMGADPYWRRRVDIDERIGVIVVHHADGAAVWHDIDSQPHTAPNMRAAMKAADEAEAQAAAKEPTP